MQNVFCIFSSKKERFSSGCGSLAPGCTVVSIGPGTACHLCFCAVFWELDDVRLRNGVGYYLGVPENISSETVQNPSDLMIPKADLLRKVMRRDSTLQYQRRGGGDRPLFDNSGIPL